MRKSTETMSGIDSPSIEKSAQGSYGIQDWQQDAPSLIANLPARNPEIKRFYENLWPIGDPYVSVLNPTFLLDLPLALSAGSPEFSEKSWLVRDGLLPLIWFYFKNPHPGAFRGTLRVHSDFEQFVPESWRPQTELYEFFSENESGYANALKVKQSASPELLLMGLIMPSVCSLDRLEEELTHIVTCLGGSKKILKMKIRAFLPARYEFSDLVQSPAYYNRFMSTVCRFLGTDIEFLEFENLKWMYPSPSTWAHEFNEKWLYADSYLSLLAFSKGCRFIPRLGKSPSSGGNKKIEYDQIIPTYPRVSCGIRKKFNEPFIDFLNGSWVPESKDRAKVFYRAMYSHANSSFPWPNWFDSWCKDFSLSRSTPLK